MRKSNNKTETGFYHSDMKYYYEDQDGMSNFENSSMDKSLKDLKFHITPKSKGAKHQKKLSFLSINAKQEKQEASLSPCQPYMHTPHISQFNLPKQ